jgi:hypothetical protein
VFLCLELLGYRECKDLLVLKVVLVLQVRKVPLEVLVLVGLPVFRAELDNLVNKDRWAH